MSAKHTKQKSRTDWKRLRAMKDEDIDFSDIPPLKEDFFKHATLRLPEPKSSITIRLDPDVLNWFKKQGKGYQTRINAILRLYMTSTRHPSVHS